MTLNKLCFYALLSFYHSCGWHLIILVDLNCYKYGVFQPSSKRRLWLPWYFHYSCCSSKRRERPLLLTENLLCTRYHIRYFTDMNPVSSSFYTALAPRTHELQRRFECCLISDCSKVRAGVQTQICLTLIFVQVLSDPWQHTYTFPHSHQKRGMIPLMFHGTVFLPWHYFHLQMDPAHSTRPVFSNECLHVRLFTHVYSSTSKGLQRTPLLFPCHWKLNAPNPTCLWASR